jgi:hypothetical protein
MDLDQENVLPATQIAGCGDASCELLVSPIPRPMGAPFKVRLKPEEPRVVLVDNEKPNSMQILERTQAILRQRGIEVAEKILKKEIPAGRPMQGKWLDRFAKERGLLVLGIND